MFIWHLVPGAPRLVRPYASCPANVSNPDLPVTAEKPDLARKGCPCQESKKLKDMLDIIGKTPMKRCELADIVMLPYRHFLHELHGNPGYFSSLDTMVSGRVVKNERIHGCRLILIKRNNGIFPEKNTFIGLVGRWPILLEKERTHHNYGTQPLQPS